MSVHNTSFYLQGAPIAGDFVGTPQEFFEEILSHTKIVSPFPFATFVTGSVKPSSNSGPWLKNGTQWWVWSDEAADYIPLDLSASESDVFWFQEDEPETFSPPLWFQHVDGKFANAYVAISSAWVPMHITSGETEDRPTSPYDFQRFYDEDIEAEIWWERGDWRTTSGVRGDVKFVTWSTAEEALERNPGWEVLGTGESVNSSWRGRIIGQATMNSGSNPASDYSVTGAVTKHAQGEMIGSETVTLSIDEIPEHSHTIKGFGYDAGAGAGKKVLVDDDHLGSPTNQDATACIAVGGDEAHENTQPTLFLWTIRKT